MRLTGSYLEEVLALVFLMVKRTFLDQKERRGSVFCPFEKIRWKMRGGQQKLVVAFFCGKSGPSGSKIEVGGSISMFGNNSRVKVSWIRGSDVGIFGNTWDISWSTGEGRDRFFSLGENTGARVTWSRKTGRGTFVGDKGFFEFKREGGRGISTLVDNTVARGFWSK